MHMYDEDFDDDDQPTGSALVKDLRKQLRDAHKENEDLHAEVTKLQSTTTKRSLEEALPPGVRKGIVKYAVKDGVTDADGLTKWLEENAEDFGIDLKAAPEETDQDGVDEDDAAAMRDVQRQTSSGGSAPSRQQQKLKELDDAESIEEWTAAANRLNGLGGAE